MEEIIVQNLAAILAALTGVCGAIVSVTAFIKSLKSERRTRVRLEESDERVAITRQGIVQAFKDAVVTKDLKLSINNQVDKKLDEHRNLLIGVVKMNEEKRTKMMYWALKILVNTASANKLTKTEAAELAELLAFINEDEQIVDTTV